MKTNNFENENVFDSRDAEERIVELEEQEDRTEDEQEELKELKKFKDEVSSSEWEYGITFIRESYFEEYAEELFDEIYANDIPVNLTQYIDYKSFAEDLKQDYGMVEFRSISFYFR